MFSRPKRIHEFFLSAPSFFWLFFFFVIPTVIVFLIAFKPHDIYGSIESGWTVENIFSLFKPQALKLIWRTLWISVVGTVLTVLLAIPVGYYLALLGERWRNVVLFAIVLPFWTSFLVRIFAWKSILHPEAFFKQMLVSWNIVSPETPLLYNVGAVIFIMAYTYLPFAILPIYAAASKFDFQLFEAALDLGASRRSAFLYVFLPAIGKGLLNAAIIVFIPILGAYVIPDVVGGTDSQMIGNRIAQKILVARNLPEASAWSMFLTLVILIPTVIGLLMHRRSKRLQLQLRNRE